MAQTFDTKTTDEYGVAELTSPAQNVVGDKTFVVRHGSVDYDTPTVEVVSVGDITLYSSNTIVFDGQSTELYARVVDDYDNPIEGIKVDIGGTLTETDVNGSASAKYVSEGNGGRTNIPVTCGNITKTIAIDDVTQYWSQSEQKKYGLSYTTRGQFSIEETMTGVLIITSKEGGIQHEGRIFFKNPFRLTESWEFSFKVVGILKRETTLHVSLADITQYTNNESFVKVTYNKNTGVRKVFVDDVEVSSNANPNVIDSDIKLIGRIRIDNIKLIKV